MEALGPYSHPPYYEQSSLKHECQSAHWFWKTTSIGYKWCHLNCCWLFLPNLNRKGWASCVLWAISTLLTKCLATCPCRWMDWLPQSLLPFTLFLGNPLIMTHPLPDCTGTWKPLTKFKDRPLNSVKVVPQLTQHTLVRSPLFYICQPADPIPMWVALPITSFNAPAGTLWDSLQAHALVPGLILSCLSYFGIIRLGCIEGSGPK